MLTFSGKYVNLQCREEIMDVGTFCAWHKLRSYPSGRAQRFPYQMLYWDERKACCISSRTFAFFLMSNGELRKPNLREGTSVSGSYFSNEIIARCLLLLNKVAAWSKKWQIRLSRHEDRGFTRLRSFGIECTPLKNTIMNIVVLAIQSYPEHYRATSISTHSQDEKSRETNDFRHCWKRRWRKIRFNYTAG